VATAKDLSVELTWTPPSGMLSTSEYRVSKKLASGAWDDEIVLSKMVSTAAVPASTGVAAVPAGETDRVNYTYEDLVNGSSYGFRIRVHNTANSKNSEYFERLNIRPYGKPDVPTSVVAVSDKRIQITLSKPVIENGRPVISYSLKRLENGSETNVPSLANDPSGNPIFIITSDIENGVEYSFNAYAINNLSPESKSLPKLINATPYGAPGKVTSLTAVGSDTNVRLTWVRPANDGGGGTLSYRVSYRYISTAAVGTEGSVGYVQPVYTDLALTTNDLFMDANLGMVNGTSTEFSVVAYFETTIEYTSASEIVNCTPFRPAAKIADTAVMVEMTSDNNISYSWAQPELYGLPFEKYMYKIMLSSNPLSDSLPWINLATNSKIVTPTQFGQQHRFLLKTVTRNGTLPLVESEVTERLYTPYKKPDPVRNLQVYAKNLSLDVIWDPPLSSGFGGYPSLKYNVVVDNIETNDPTSNEKVTISGLDNKLSYTISVIAIGYLDGEPKQISEIRSASGAPHGTPDKPTSFTAVPQKSSSVLLSWVAPIGYIETPVKYTIFRDGDRIVDDYDGTSYENTGLAKGTSYKFKVMTKQLWSDNYVSYSDFTDEITATPYDNPNPVQNLNVLVADRSMTINWNPLIITNINTDDRNGINGTVYYDIVVRKNSDYLEVKNASQTGTSVTFDGLVNGVEYIAQVNSNIYNSEINEDVKSTVEQLAKIVSPLPTGPVDPEFTAGNNKITVKWFGATADTYSLVYYEFYVNDVFKTTSMLDARSSSGTKNSIDLNLGNATSNVVKIRRVASNSTGQYESEWSSSLSLMPYGTPIIDTAVINSLDRKKLDFVIRPDGSKITKIVALIITDKYSSSDQSFQEYSVTNPAASGSISESLSFAIATGTNITSFLAIVVNDNGLITVYPTSPQ
jgi:hypothetical protein